ncbi:MULTISPECIES: hypothetical protein [Gammaproteobacteria]|uniref:hypothetical protein n=1 Tax=Gammaproteobacteria TaxID=1236 RepID=UPI000DCF9A39|nr:MULTISPECIES: hypothetical protein [Gammaproteobacteria]RTE86664.1 hypothetical protein DQX04_08920 [Aliidiomarina sp. B3213]TCZ90783.1 hypothetical protein EYQ95_08125 [Lysobacter sp. N42]
MTIQLFILVVLAAIVVVIFMNRKKQQSSSEGEASTEKSEQPEPAQEQETPEPLPKAEQTPGSPAIPEALEEIAEPLDGEKDPLVRHKILSQLTEKAYKHRKDDEYRDACIHYSVVHIQEFSDIKEPLKEANGGNLPQVMTFQNYANLLLEQERFDESVKVCEQALEFGLDDKTQTGFEGRIKRIRSKQKKAG